MSNKKEESKEYKLKKEIHQLSNCIEELIKERDILKDIVKSRLYDLRITKFGIYDEEEFATLIRMLDITRQYDEKLEVFENEYKIV
jgi:hypothetical protein